MGEITMRTTRALTFLLAASALLASGCASRQYVKEQLKISQDTTEQRLTQIEDQVETNQTQIDQHSETLTEQQGQLDAQQQQLAEVSGTARDALSRAQAAGKLAEGKFLYETTLSDSQVGFGLNVAELSADARAALDAFAAQIVAENADVYIEIQGHTDSSGPDAYNYELGLKRAETVKRYLNHQHNFPLHRMSVVSYGESEPVADNDSREGRAKNRRVVLVVLR